MKAKAYNLVNSVEQEEMDAGLLAESFSVEAKGGPDPLRRPFFKGKSTSTIRP